MSPSSGGPGKRKGKARVGPRHVQGGDQYFGSRLEDSAGAALGRGARGNYQETGALYVESGAHVYFGNAETPPVPKMLPPDSPTFTGRTHELRLCQAILSDEKAQRVVAVAGTAGVGKSAMAIHVAHLIKDGFTGGQLYIDLRGDDDRAVVPLEALSTLLHALGTPIESIRQNSGSVKALASLYRTCLAHRRVLIVLDNAREVSQVRPLVPGSGSCAVIITSRRSLAVLPGVSQLRLGPLTEEESLSFLRRSLGDERVDLELDAAKQLIGICDRLPLALCIAAARLASGPVRRFSGEVTRLQDERKRLGRMQEGDLNVQASLYVSYRDLSTSQSQLFRFLGLWDGTDFSSGLAAALLDLHFDENEAREIVEELVDMQLVELSGEERYRIHDLIRLFAKERGEDEESTESRTMALARAATWYFVGAEQHSMTRSGLSLEEYRVALSWIERERLNFRFAVEAAVRSGTAVRLPGSGREQLLATRLALSFENFFHRLSYWTEWQQTYELALGASRREGDRHETALLLGGLANLYELQSRWADAEASYKEVLAILGELGDRAAEARTLGNLGIVYRNLRRLDEARSYIEQAWAIFHDLKDCRAEAQALDGIGTICRLQGYGDEARTYHEQAREMYREQQDRHGEAQALGNLGILFWEMGRLDEARGLFESVLELFGELGDRHSVAVALTNLANLCLKNQEWEQAKSFYERARSAFREVGDLHLEGMTLVNLGILYERQGEIEIARSVWTGALEALIPMSVEYRQLSTHLERVGLPKQ